MASEDLPFPVHKKGKKLCEFSENVFQGLWTCRPHRCLSVEWVCASDRQTYVKCLMLYLVYLIKMRFRVLRFCLFEKLLFICAGVFLKEGACPVTWLQLLPGVTSDFKAVGCAGGCPDFVTLCLLRKLLCYMWNSPKELSAAVPSDQRVS